MTEKTQTELLFNPMLDQLLERHPLPWTAQHDWTLEVIATDGTIIAKCLRSDQAQAIINFAERRQAVLDSHKDAAQQFLDGAQTS